MSQAVTEETTLKRTASRPRIFHRGDRVTFTLDTTLGRTEPISGTVKIQDVAGFVHVVSEQGYDMRVPADNCTLLRLVG